MLGLRAIFNMPLKYACLIDGALFLVKSKTLALGTTLFK
jgi:hypothetical protein